MSENLEDRIREHLEASDYDAAVTAALQGYGPEVYGFLIARMQHADHAHDVFAQACEDAWKGIAKFAGRSSFKTWFYVLARNAAHRFERSPHNQEWRHTTTSKLEALVEKIRTETEPFRRTDAKEAFAKVREELSVDERTLLVLKVNRGMTWQQIACVMADDPEADDEELARVSARLRQRFTALKRKLKGMVEDAGLLDRDAG